MGLSRSGDSPGSLERALCSEILRFKLEFPHFLVGGRHLISLHISFLLCRMRIIKPYPFRMLERENWTVNDCQLEYSMRVGNHYYHYHFGHTKDIGGAQKMLNKHFFSMFVILTK